MEKTSREKQTIILDLAAGDNTRNDPKIIKQMIDEIYLLSRQTKKEIILKFQLFDNIKGLTPLDKKLFCYAYYYAEILGLKVTASVFSKTDLHFLLSFINTPFIKIACRDYLYKLIKYIPSLVDVMVSVDSVVTRDKLIKRYPHLNFIFLMCVAKYPAEPIEYECMFQGLDDSGNLNYGISDHTRNVGMYRRFQPKYYERHFILSHAGCLDPYGSSFASTAKELEIIL